jgi:hypothetical protein
MKKSKVAVPEELWIEGYNRKKSAWSLTSGGSRGGSLTAAFFTAGRLVIDALEKI